MAQRPPHASDNAADAMVAQPEDVAGRVAWISPTLGGLRSDLAKRWLERGGRLASFEGVQQGLRVDVWIGPTVLDECELSKRCAVKGRSHCCLDRDDRPELRRNRSE